MRPREERRRAVHEDSPAHKAIATNHSRGADKCLRLLRWYASHHTKVFPGQKKLAQHLGVSDRQVRTYLAELREAG